MGLFLSQLVVLPREAMTASAILDSYETADRATGSGGGDRRRVRAIASPTRRWWTVEDEAHGLQDIPLIRAMAKAWSAGLEAPVISAIVHDSDVLWLDLHRPGRKVCTWCSESDQDDEAMSSVARSFPLAEWRELFVSSDDLVTWQAGLESPPRFIEDLLRRLGGLLGWGPLASDTPFASGTETVDRQIGERESGPSDASAPTATAEGKPVLRLTCWTQGFETITGEDFSLSVTLVADCAPARGIQVVLWGPAVEAGLLERVRIRIGLSGGTDGTGEQSVTRCEDVSDGQRRLLVVRMPTITVPVGTPLPTSLRAVMRTLMAGLQQQVAIISIEGGGGHPGTHPWYVGIRPLENTPAGDVSLGVSAVVLPRPWRPARHAGGDASSDLRDLATPAAFVAVVYLDPAIPDVDDRVVASFTAWWRLVGSRAVGKAERIILAAGKERLSHGKGPVPSDAAAQRKLDPHLRTAQMAEFSAPHRWRGWRP